VRLSVVLNQKPYRDKLFYIPLSRIKVEVLSFCTLQLNYHPPPPFLPHPPTPSIHSPVLQRPAHAPPSSCQSNRDPSRRSLTTRVRPSPLPPPSTNPRARRAGWQARSSPRQSASAYRCEAVAEPVLLFFLARKEFCVLDDLCRLPVASWTSAASA
jgi:hypothetical protein